MYSQPSWVVTHRPGIVVAGHPVSTFTGDVTGPQPDIIVTIGNVLRNAFIRAYLPKLQHGQRIEGMQFQPPSLDEPATLLQ